MEDNFAIQLFEGKKVRIVWNEAQEKYYFSVVDIVQVLTDSVDAKQYIKRLRARDPELNLRWGTICTPTEMRAADGKVYKTQAADLQGIFRIIQSIPSKKAEPVKQWLAQLGEQRIDQMIDPELTFQMAVEAIPSSPLNAPRTISVLSKKAKRRNCRLKKAIAKTRINKISLLRLPFAQFQLNLHAKCRFFCIYQNFFVPLHPIWVHKRTGHIL